MAIKTCFVHEKMEGKPTYFRDEKQEIKLKNPQENNFQFGCHTKQNLIKLTPVGL